jgi:acyl carrier protein
MSTAGSELDTSYEAVLGQIVQILRQMTSDWDLDYIGGIHEDTLLMSDLGFESIDVVQLVVAVEEQFEREDLPFETLLMTDGRYVDDLAVRDLTLFVRGQLQAA